DALAAIAATETIEYNKQGKIDITPETARSLVALRDGGLGVVSTDDKDGSTGAKTADIAAAKSAPLQAASPP
ncbi:MAG: hypothetical protein AAFV54_12650, partial [Pseudomonadota bacterium]